MLKETIRKNENVRLFDSLSTKKIAAFLVGGTIHSLKGAEILTDGRLKLLNFDSYEVEITEPHWLILRDSNGFAASVDDDWLDKVFLSEKDFIRLCLALAMPEVRPIRFYSEEKYIVHGHTRRLISGIILSGIEPANFNRLVVFDEKSGNSYDFLFTPGEGNEETYPLDLGLELTLFVKGFLIRD